MRKVPDGHRRLLLDIRQERPAILHQEVEDAVLIRQLEGGAEDGGEGGGVRRHEVEAVEWRQHRKLELHGVGGGRDEGDIFVPGPL